MKEQAIMYGEKAVEISPEDPRLLSNLKWYRGEQHGTTP
jgi:hypothetical protein